MEVGGGWVKFQLVITKKLENIFIQYFITLFGIIPKYPLTEKPTPETTKSVECVHSTNAEIIMIIIIVMYC